MRRTRRLLLIHQPGKVGSRAVYRAFHDVGLHKQFAIFHTHSLEPTLRKQRRRERSAGSWAPRFSWAQAEHISRIIRSGRDRPLVLTIVRNPFEAHPSAFLQNPDWFIPQFRLHRDDIGDVPFHTICAAYRDVFPHLERLRWYDSEIAELFGVDIFGDRPIQRHVHYTLFSSSRADVAVFRYEELADATRSFARDHLGADVELRRVNDTAQKGFGGLLSRLRSECAVPDEIANAIRTSRLYRTYYDAR